MRREFKLPNRGIVTGMAIPQGVTLIVGGGFHGKSTLLQALELGVYDHIPGDGREFVCTDPTAVKIRCAPCDSLWSHSTDCISAELHLWFSGVLC